MKKFFAVILFAMVAVTAPGVVWFMYGQSPSENPVLMPIVISWLLGANILALIAFRLWRAR
ncbi:MAG: hypothetical protein ACFE0P_14040 [Oceanicaulis sp.]